MRAQGRPSILRAGSALAFVLVLLPLLGACTKGGQFDPTEVLNSDMFDSKKKITGQREPVFPGGVPGTTTGVPADLVKGYQPPPDPSDVDASQQPGGGPPGAAPKRAAATATAEAKPKPKPRPKVATGPAQAPAQSGDPIWNQAPAQSRPPTRINVGAKPAATAPAQDQAASSQTNWPSPSQQMTPAQQVQTNWPAPPSGAPAQKTQ